MVKLERCPFCGSDLVEFVPDEEQQIEDTTTGFIWCHGCGFSSDSFYNEKIAAEKWNRRAAPKIKALTLEDGFEITNADGMPIDYESLGLKYKDRLCYCDIDGFYLGQEGNLVLMDDCGNTVEVDRRDYHIAARKSEVQNEH